jgi:hypothetical protein
MRRSVIMPFLLLGIASGAIAQSEIEISQITPAGGPSSGGTQVAIMGTGFQREVDCVLPCPTVVTFGGIEIPVKSAGLNGVVAVTPAHEPGTVDVTVNVAGKKPLTLVNGFTFTPSQQDAYEEVLLPVYLESEVNGAFGARWKTDLWMRNNALEPIRLAAWPCPAGEICPAAFPLTYNFEGERSLRNLPPLPGRADGNPSRLLYLDREGAANVAFSLRFADVSRAPFDGGVEMPVIRQAEMLGGVAQLLDVPLGPAFRVLLRLYEVAYPSSRYRVTIFPQAEVNQPPVHSRELTVTSSYTGDFRPKAGYASLDITGLLQEAKAWPQNARIEITPLTPGSRYWAFASITTNDTQIVTLVTPQ